MRTTIAGLILFALVGCGKIPAEKPGEPAKVAAKPGVGAVNPKNQPNPKAAEPAGIREIEPTPPVIFRPAVVTPTTPTAVSIPIPVPVIDAPAAAAKRLAKNSWWKNPDEKKIAEMISRLGTASNIIIVYDQRGNWGELGSDRLNKSAPFVLNLWIHISLGTPQTGLENLVFNEKNDYRALVVPATSARRMIDQCETIFEESLVQKHLTYYAYLAELKSRNNAVDDLFKSLDRAPDPGIAPPAPKR